VLVEPDERCLPAVDEENVGTWVFGPLETPLASADQQAVSSGCGVEDALENRTLHRSGGDQLVPI
jgi:hypothetical protein